MEFHTNFINRLKEHGIDINKYTGKEYEFKKNGLIIHLSEGKRIVGHMYTQKQAPSDEELIYLKTKNNKDSLRWKDLSLKYDFKEINLNGNLEAMVPTLNKLIIKPTEDYISDEVGIRTFFNKKGDSCRGK